MAASKNEKATDLIVAQKLARTVPVGVMISIE